jgi:hypothetical protein
MLVNIYFHKILAITDIGAIGIVKKEIGAAIDADLADKCDSAYSYCSSVVQVLGNVVDSFEAVFNPEPVYLTGQEVIDKFNGGWSLRDTCPWVCDNLKEYNPRNQHIFNTWKLVFKWFEEGKDRILEEDIQSLHKTLLEYRTDITAGIYRSDCASRDGKYYMPHEMIPEEMKRLCKWFNSSFDLVLAGERNPIEFTARLIQDLHSIHPFRDGNTRTTSMLGNFVLMRAGLFPVRNEMKYGLRRESDNSIYGDSIEKVVGYLLTGLAASKKELAVVFSTEASSIVVPMEIALSTG